MYLFRETESSAGAADGGEDQAMGRPPGGPTLVPLGRWGGGDAQRRHRREAEHDLQRLRELVAAGAARHGERVAADFARVEHVHVDVNVDGISPGRATASLVLSQISQRGRIERGMPPKKAKAATWPSQNASLVSAR